jgi:redox-sensitive bicupin YhaK (pirin superfamily)
MSIRPVKRLVRLPTLEGAGVHLRHAFVGHLRLDPFRLLDDFRNDVRRIAWRVSRHPHRGIETITYVLPEPWSTAIAWETTAPSPPVTSSG